MHREKSVVVEDTKAPRTSLRLVQAATAGCCCVNKVRKCPALLTAVHASALIKRALSLVSEGVGV